MLQQLFQQHLQQNANQGNNGTGNATGGTQNNDGDTTTAEDEDVPQGLVDLDDEDTPKSNISVNNEKNSSTPIYAGIAISLAAICRNYCSILWQLEKKKSLMSQKKKEPSSYSM